jgi:histone deacetylase 11
LVSNKYLNYSQFIKAKIVKESQLLLIHTKKYLEELKDSTILAQAIELPPLAYVPNFLLQWKLCTPMVINSL